ncbi:MAG: hypothetical protein ACTSRC_01300 [Candidatus Helarchaeota archaeon]
MTNITFSVDIELHKKMKAHPEIKWSEILRRAIIEFLRKIEEPDQISVEKLREQLDNDILYKIDNLNINREIEFYEKTRKMELKRLEHLKNLERSSED